MKLVKGPNYESFVNATPNYLPVIDYEFERDWWSRFTPDFVDDYMVDPILRNDQSFLFLVTISKQGIKKLKLIPTLISNMQVNLAPEPEQKKIIKRMQALSLPFGTAINNEGILAIKF